MAGKFMRIRRIVLPIMSLIILTSQLAGCATLNSQEFLETVNNVDEVVIEYSELDDATKLATDQIQVGGQQYTVGTEDEADNAAIGLVDTQQTEDQQELSELSGDALHTYFQKAYDMRITIDGGMEVRISGELDILVTLVDTDGTGKLPEDYEAQYRSWREAQLFTEVNETVYVTGTVNLRSGPGTENDKVGSMSKGDSATRTGIGINDADGWSRIQLSDGSIVYVGNSYISTTKPATQQQQTTQQTQTQQQQQTQTENKQTEQSKQEESSVDLSGFNFAKPNENKGTTSQQMPTAAEIEAHKRATDPTYYVDENGEHSRAANGNENIGIN